MVLAREERVFLKSQVRGTFRSSQRDPLVFLHGWGSDSTLWHSLLVHLETEYPVILIDLPGFGFNASCQVLTLDDLYPQIKKLLPKRSHIVGWSLGGMVAAQLCSRYPEQFLSLTTIASNAKFSSTMDWKQACGKDVFDKFMSSFLADAETTVNRFFQIQAQGDGKRKELVKIFRKNDISLTENQRQQWAIALEWLNNIDNREVLRALTIPHRAFFGEKDALVPSGVKDIFIENSYASSCVTVDDSAHAPHITQPEYTADSLKAFLQEAKRLFPKNGEYKRDKKKVAKSFSEAAKNYDRTAILQRKVANCLLSLNDSYLGNICDLGCGTGFCMDEINRLGGNVIGLDLAHGMLKFSLDKKTHTNERTVDLVNDALICGDFDSLPLASNVFDGLCSSMSVQWSDNLTQVFSEARRVLKPNAWLLFSTLGPSTLNELRSSWENVDGYVHINRFDENDKVNTALSDAGFEVESNITEFEILEYNSVFTLMRELKAIGAHNLNAGKNTGLTTRTKLKKLESAYEKYRKCGHLPATYEVYYFLARAC